MKDKKTAIGVTYLNRMDGKYVKLAGDRVVVASGTIETPKILQASKSSFWPNGIGNDTDHVGRYLITHPLISAYARIENNVDRLEQEVDFPTMSSRFFDTPEYQNGGKMFFVRDGKYIVAKPAERLIQNDSPNDINSDIVSKTKVELRALIEACPAPQNRVTIADAGGATASGLPRSKIVYSEHDDTAKARAQHLERLLKLLYKAGLKAVDPGSPSRSRADHSTGTCRMSATAATGVVDKDLRVHETENVFIASNAVFPNSGAVNPTLTLVALCLRLGERLAV
jgi:choline dehydrogenase-like flavoprotein